MDIWADTSSDEAIKPQQISFEINGGQTDVQTNRKTHNHDGWI
jgi:hypothetical protein